MQKLIETTRKIIQENETLPFSVYCSSEEQRMLNVPINKPLLIFVLSGRKELGTRNDIVCPSGHFIFLSNTPTIAMRNIPNEVEYFALLIEFDYSDFNCLEHRHRKLGTNTHFIGPIESRLEYTVQQFAEWSTFSPSDMWHLRRQEILQVLASLGFNQVGAIMKPPTLSYKVHTIVSSNIASDFNVEDLSSELAMSESTLRRKLRAEGSSIQAIKDRAKLGYGLHLVQTTFESIGQIAEQCGYSSQSRFTEKFRQLFDITPTELRKTRMPDSGE